MSFLRHREIYRPMVTGKTPERSGCDRSGLIGTMSFRLAIPGGLPPAAPASAHQPGAECATVGSCRSEFFSERSTVSYSIVSAQGSTITRASPPIYGER